MSDNRSCKTYSIAFPVATHICSSASSKGFSLISQPTTTTTPTNLLQRQVAKAPHSVRESSQGGKKNKIKLCGWCAVWPVKFMWLVCSLGPVKIYVADVLSDVSNWDGILLLVARDSTRQHVTLEQCICG